MANVCCGDADRLMPLDHLTLAEYLEHPDALFLPEFGGRWPPEQVSTESSASAPSSFEYVSESNSDVASSDSDVTPLGDISDRCYYQLDK